MNEPAVEPVDSANGGTPPAAAEPPVVEPVAAEPTVPQPAEATPPDPAVEQQAQLEGYANQLAAAQLVDAWPQIEQLAMEGHDVEALLANVDPAVLELVAGHLTGGEPVDAQAAQVGLLDAQHAATEQVDRELRDLVTGWEAELGELSFDEVGSRAADLLNVARQYGVELDDNAVKDVLRLAAEQASAEKRGAAVIDSYLAQEHQRVGEFDDREVIELAERALPDLVRRGFGQQAAARIAIQQAARAATADRGARSFADLGQVTRYRSDLMRLERQDEAAKPAAAAAGVRATSLDKGLAAVTAKHAALLREGGAW
jgi:hypothetical protein